MQVYTILKTLTMKTQDSQPNDSSHTSKSVKKSRKVTMRKSLHAPKRFKSSYILFFMQVKDKIKAELGGNVSVSFIDF